MSLVIRDLKKTYRTPLSRKPPMEAVKGVSFHIEPGEIYALLGPNGAGKSTIIKMIAGLIVPTAGEILINGQVSSPSHPVLYKNLSAILEGTRNVYWRLNPLENLHYFANLRGIPSSRIKEKSVELLEYMDIEAKKKNQSQHLSRGMLQKLALAVALVTDPVVLLLDEPTLGLDVSSARKIKDMVLDLAKNQNKAILLTTHQMNLVEEVADRVGIIRQGELVVEGTMSDLKAIFQNFIYKFKVRGKFALPAEWQKKYGAKILSEQSDATEFEIDCGDNEGVYRVLADLKASDLEILTMGRDQEDLESIFLRVLSEPTQAPLLTGGERS